MSQISVVQYSPSKVLPHPGDRPVILLRQPKQDDDVLLTNTARKGAARRGGAKGDPKAVQPMAVARRNARERNRVKQVNNGFANLRQHIPSFIAQAFEGAGRNKKLSKVETLRMAVEYIRSLEDVLAMNGVAQPDHNSQDLSSPDNCSNTPQFSFEDDDSISTTSTPPPQQLIRINTTDNTYEIISNNVFENGENLDPITLQNLAVDTLEFAEDLSYLNVDSMQTTGSLSPGIYSEDSLSPNGVDKKENMGFVSVFNAERLSPNINVEIKAEVSDHPVLSLKTEKELPDTQKDLVADVINWWETQPQYTGGS